MKTPKRATNSDLRELFDLYNGLYFSRALKVPLDLSFNKIDGLGHTFRFRHLHGPKRPGPEPFGIHIASSIRFSRQLCATTLLHEMVHLEQKNKYGCGIRSKRFNDRMRQLANAGAFDGIW